MRRREQREHVFKLMFMTEFNSEEEMTEQLSLYFEGLGELSEQCKPWMEDKAYEPCGSCGTSSSSI